MLRWLGTLLPVAMVASVAAVADAPPDTAGAPATVRLDLVGTVPSHCGFKTAPAKDLALGELGAAGQYETSFSLDCNAAFAVRVASVHGGLTRAGHKVPAGFAARLDYDIAMRIDTDLGTVGGECAASALAHGCALSGWRGLSSGKGVAMGTDGELTLRWSAPAKRLVAGDYQDSIIITVEARP